MIQAEIGGGARVEPGNSVQRPGFMIRDFTLPSSDGKSVRISSFHGRSNLAVVFPGHSDAMCRFLEDLAKHNQQFSEQDTTVMVVLPHGLEVKETPIVSNASIVVLYDETWEAYRLSGVTDEIARPIQLIYLTDRFGEIAATYVVSDRSTPPSIGEILRTLEFVNHQCPECEPPEWPR